MYIHMYVCKLGIDVIFSMQHALIPCQPSCSVTPPHPLLQLLRSSYTFKSNATAGFFIDRGGEDVRPRMFQLWRRPEPGREGGG